MQEQTDLYKQQTEQKLNEQKELLKILKDYKQKYTEFEKATKKTKDYYKNFEKEIRQLDVKRKDLQKIKSQLEQKTSQGKKKGKGAKSSGNDQAAKQEAEDKEVEDMRKNWLAQKDNMAKERETLKAECADLQAKIKAKKEAAQ